MEEKLTFDQSKALNKFSSWLKKKNDGMPFVLSGYAGSGKTFLSMHFLKLVEKKNICWTTVAPTHKAVGVLHQSLSSKGLRPTWYPSTIHRLLRLKIKRKGYLEVCEATEQTNSSLEQLGLVLIDEASMLDANLLEILFQCAHNSETRLVFVGDPAQLPPIGEEISSVFSIKRAFKSELIEVVRHQGPVLKLASSIREGQIPCLPPPVIPKIVSKKSVVGCLTGDVWLEKAKEALKNAALEGNPNAARILCYTNRSLEKLVPHARRAIHGEMADQFPVLPGEVLITRMAVMAPASCSCVDAREEPDMVLGSNRELVVLDVKPESYDMADFGLSINTDNKTQVIDTLSAKVRAGDVEVSLRLLPPVGSNARRLLDSTLKDLRDQAKDNSKKGNKTLWKKFFLLRDAFASLGPASVLTVHRSQGSTFSQVFISSDVFWPNDLSLRKQLVYVAVSRASEGVWLLAGEDNLSLNQHWSDFVFNCKAK